MRTSFLGVALDVLSMDEVLEAACGAVASRRAVLHGSLNALKVVEARKDTAIRSLLGRLDLVTPDGMSVVWGLKALGQGKAERVAGVDLMTRLLEAGAGKGWRFFLLGARPDVADVLKARVEGQFPGVEIVGVAHGYFGDAEEPAIADRIRTSCADVLLVGMPSPRKERFLVEHKERLGVPFAMGVGGGLDLLAGRTRRAPVWMQRAGLEWGYRVLQEPGRLAGRYLVSNLRFAGILAAEMLHTRRTRGSRTC